MARVGRLAAWHADTPGLCYRRLARDAVLVATGVAITKAVADTDWVRENVPLIQAAVVMMVLAGAAALVAGVLGILVGYFVHDGRAAWRGAALAVYGLIEVPVSTLRSATEAGNAAIGAVRLSAHCCVGLMLLAGICLPAARRLRTSTFVLIAVGATIPVISAVLAVQYPAEALRITSSIGVQVGVSALWLTAAVMIAHQGLGSGLSPGIRVGYGFLVVSFAHMYAIQSELAHTGGLVPDLTFSSVRLFGLLIVVTAALELARRVLNQMGDDQQESQEELVIAEVGLARLAERDHELRNGIAGLAGAALVLRGFTDGPEHGGLDTAVTVELNRLDALLSTHVVAR